MNDGGLCLYWMAMLLLDGEVMETFIFAALMEVG